MSIFKDIAGVAGKVVKGAIDVVDATGIGGPIGKIAKGIVGPILGLGEDSSEEEIRQALATANPEQLVELTRANNEFRVRVKELDAELQKIDAADRASARDREVKLKDWATKTLAFLFVAGWGGFTYALFRWPIPEASHDLLLVSFGILSSAVTGIVAYYFGSSAGSARKTEIMNGGNK